MVLEFPNSRNDWRLDAVGLLAVIGETTTETCVEPMTASYLCLLPRLIPAPQALIRPNRRLTLANVNANVTGIHNGTVRPVLSYTANQLYPIANLAPFSVHVLRVRHREQNYETSIEMDPPRNTSRTEGDGERGQFRPLRRRATSIIKNYTPPQPVMRAKNMAPHSILSVASCLLTIGLLVWAIVIGDGPATLSIVLLATATTLFCAASLWSLPLRQRSFASIAPAGDVVIRTRVGAFLIIQCDEDVARELYYGTDEVRQLVTTGFGSCVGGGTVIFMVAVILMGNSTWTMQAALAVAYLLLNAVYWFVALIPSTTHWEFPSYEIDDVTPDDVKYSNAGTMNSPPSYTNSLWKAILVSKKIGWVRRSNALPETHEWDHWLKLAEQNALDDNRGWDAVKTRVELRGGGL
ncbi:Uncharacterized protein BP5553_08889 [Venustampulla echinocandica]|uniref:Uncharacterized protein n=1 Tax=Venustampulla echinocandica TaxID=2656787 RepID=A0A370TD89_9HELO|nr:Uncharacterized protein BP5553_08889 [Venustampulla echinocandica]RDL32433.1 Uncharacterized protein BP5553_08889 [Venustampulla echinocandica]